MLDSGPKQPENRIHLYDPVGLINDGYGSYRPSSYTVRPRRQTVSCDNIVETTINSDTILELTSYDSFNDHANSTGGLRSYDSFEVESLSLRSLNENITSEANGGRVVSSYDNTATAAAAATTIDQDRNDVGLRFTVMDNVDEDESDSSTPRLWGPSAPTSPESLYSPLQLPKSPHSVNSSASHSISPHSVNSSPSHSTSPKSANSTANATSTNSVNNSSPLYATSAKSVKFSPSNPNKSANTSPSQTSPTHPHFQNMSANSRTQAIAKGRRELMDMVRDLPESFYELSLRDIVEKKPETEMEVKKEIDVSEEKKTVKESNMAKETKKQKKGSSKKVKKSESKKKMVRSRSVDNGKFLLKTSVFPILLSRKSKKNTTVSNSFKVAPMPKGGTTSSGNTKAGEKDWWRRKSCISSESDDSNGLDSHNSSSHSSTSSSRSNSSNGRRSNKFLPSCCLFNGRRIRDKK